LATNKPRQKRSRERVEKIMLAAADELARTADADALTTTSVAKRSGVPVATIYRYFADRSAIISALIDEETHVIDEVINFENLLQAIMRAHLAHFQSSRRSIVLWFGARNSKEVIKRVDRRYAYLGSWLMDGAMRSGMAINDVPPYGAELIVWTCDRAFEFMFREKREPATELEIMELGLNMLYSGIDGYATDRGREGISREEFLKHFGPFDPPTGPPD
jgi:AcrR family transcriptional regulator